MKMRWIFCALLVSAALGFFAGTGFSDDSDQPSDDEMMKMMMELAKPGPSHKALDPMVGEWNVESKMWMKPGDPDVTHGTASSKWILGGRYAQYTYAGTYMGMPFNGHGLMGFDNFKKVYQSVWIDNLGTTMMISEGKKGKADGTFDFNYVWDGPMGKMPGRMRYTIKDKDKYVLEGWMTMKGEDGKPHESKHMELTFTRKK